MLQVLDKQIHNYTGRLLFHTFLHLLCIQSTFICSLQLVCVANWFLNKYTYKILCPIIAGIFLLQISFPTNARLWHYFFSISMFMLLDHGMASTKKCTSMFRMELCECWRILHFTQCNVINYGWWDLQHFNVYTLQNFRITI